jgi:predicted transcriptional regulator
MSEKQEEGKILGLTARIVSAHVANNATGSEVLPKVIRDIYTALTNVSVPDAPPVEKLSPAVPVKKSVFPDYIICLEDGKRLKMLKRHLASAYNLTPEQYREKWGLAVNYPMVAPNYAERRSSLAKQIGLGTRRATS